MIKMALFHTDRRAEQLRADDLDEARRIAAEHVGNLPKLEGSGLFGYAFDRHTGKSLRVVAGAKLRDVFPFAS